MSAHEIEVSQLPEEQRLLFKLINRVSQQQTESIKNEIHNCVKSLNIKIDNVNKEIDDIKKRCSEVERKLKKNNIVIFGILLRKNENLLNKTLKVLNDNFQVNIEEHDVNNIFKLGKEDKSPILLEFTSFIKKLELFKNKEKLKKFNENGFGIANDLNKEDREELKILRIHLKDARSQNLEAKIKGFHLHVNNQTFSAEQLKDLESEEEAGTSDSENNYSEKSVDNSVKKPNSSNLNSTVVERTEVKSTRRRSKFFRYSPISLRSSKI